MQKKTKIVSAVLVGLGLAGCAAPADSNVSESIGYGSDAPRTTQLPAKNYENRPWMHTDGTPDYDALRREFGAPNTNLKIFANAVDLAKTTGMKSLKVEEGQISFASADTAFMAHVKAGDPLYCGAACATQFVRKVKSVKHENGRVIVLTDEGNVLDILERGWLHDEIDMPIAGLGHSDAPSADFNPQARGGILGGIIPDSVDIPIHKDPIYTYTPSLPKYTQQLAAGTAPNNTTGTLTVTPSFTAKLNVDLVATASTSSPYIRISDFKVTVEAAPQLDVKIANFTANASYTKDWNLYVPGAITIANQQLFGGALGVIPSITFKGTVTPSVTAHVDADGALTLNAEASAKDTLTLGFEYNGDGAEPIYTNSFTDTWSFNATGKASAHAYATFALDIKAELTNVAKAEAKATARAGIELTASGVANANSSGTQNSCGATLTGDLYFALTGVDANVDVTLNVLGSHPLYNHDWPMDDKRWQFPDPAWTKTFTLNDAGQCLGTDAGPSAGGTGGGTGGQTGTTAGTTATSGGPTNNNVKCGIVDDCGLYTGDRNSTCSGGECTCHCPNGTVCKASQGTSVCDP